MSRASASGAQHRPSAPPSARLLRWRGLGVRALPVALFSLLTVVGLAVHDDYGVGWDESNNRLYGQLTEGYIEEYFDIDIPGGHRLYSMRPGFNEEQWKFWDPAKGRFARTHGPLFELLLLGAQRLASVDGPRHVYFLRHIGTFTAFVIGALFLYLFCRRAFDGRVLPALGVVLLVLHPRIFAHAFHNSMDIPFLAATAAAMYTLLRWLRLRTLPAALWHGVACAALVGIRIAGVIMVAITFGFLVLEVIVARRRRRAARFLGLGSVNFLIVLCLLVVVFWPMLWPSPLANFLDAFDLSARDPWDWWEIYLGEKVHGHSVPWHFTPVWMAVTTPPLVLAMFVAGLVRLGARLRAPLELHRQQPGVLIGLATFALPLAAVAALGSTLFNGWRHMYFIYPGFVVVALWGGDGAWRLVRRRLGGLRRTAALAALALALALSAGSTVAFMVRSHPHQLIYFNLLTGGVKGGARMFQIGYWGPEYREALEYVLRLRPRGPVAIYVTEDREPLRPVEYNVKILPRAQRGRVRLVEHRAEAEFYLTNHCSHVPTFPFKELWSRRVDGVRVVTVYSTGDR